MDVDCKQNPKGFTRLEFESQLLHHNLIFCRVEKWLSRLYSKGNRRPWVRILTSATTMQRNQQVIFNYNLRATDLLKIIN